VCDINAVSLSPISCPITTTKEKLGLIVSFSLVVVGQEIE
jgi:hypothetical protein